MFAPPLHTAVASENVQGRDVEKQIERLTPSTSNVHAQESKGQYLLFYYHITENFCGVQFSQMVNLYYLED